MKNVGISRTRPINVLRKPFQQKESDEPLCGDEMDLELCFLELGCDYVQIQTSNKAAKREEKN